MTDQTINPDQLAELGAIPDGLQAVVFSPSGPLQKVPFELLLAKLIPADLVKTDFAALAADLAHDENTVALIHNDPTALQNGWYRKTGASGEGAWAQFETLSKAVADAALGSAEIAAEKAELAIEAAGSASAAGNYIPGGKIAGEAGTITGEFFSYSDGIDGVIYAERTADGAGDEGGNSTFIGRAATEGQIAAIAAGFNAPDGSRSIGFLPSGAGAAPRSLESKVRETISVLDFGAIGDGTLHTIAKWIIPGALGRFIDLAALQVEYPHVTATTDGIDWAACQAALNAASNVFFPDGRYYLERPLTLNDGQHIYGCGKSAWEPYTGGAFPDVTRTEILVDSNLAFEASGTNSAKIIGVAIKAVGGAQSAFGFAAGKQVGSRGIDITSSLQFEAKDVSFHGLEVAVDANQGVNEPSSQMPRISDWMATDCGTVFRFGNAASPIVDGSIYTVRDPLISDSVIALHCDKMIDAHFCDGLRLENVRLFQAFDKSVYVRATPFVSFVGLTAFETAEEQVTLDGCKGAVMTGMNLSRAGGYKSGGGGFFKTALSLINCETCSFQGTIEESFGFAIDLVGCTGTRISASVGKPYFTFGGASNTNGAINVLISKATNISVAFAGDTYQVAVWADLESSRTLTGTVAGGDVLGVVRCSHMQQKGGLTIREEVATEVVAGATSAAFYTIRAWISAGKVLKARCVEMTSPNIVLRVGASFWTDAEPEGGGSISLEDKVLYDNTAGPDGWYLIPLTFHNPTAATVTVPLWHETRISTALT